jgi:pyruvoyl-dependent arginine decarboxylase (PvlArgDC)
MLYAKLNNGAIEKYPYTIGDLRKDNPNTSFPSQISQAILDEYNVVSVVSTPQPSVNYTKNVTEGLPEFTDGQWKQTWVVTNNPDAESIAEGLRADAYRNESNPIFFKWQRGEATEQEWLDKIAEIKARYQKD